MIKSFAILFKAIGTEKSLYNQGSKIEAYMKQQMDLKLKEFFDSFKSAWAVSDKNPLLKEYQEFLKWKEQNDSSKNNS